MAKVPMLPPDEATQTDDSRRGPAPDLVIRERVLATLGSPPGLFRLAVVRLWKGYYRVNVVVGADASSVRVAHSYFVEATDRGDILSAKPPIVRLYP